MTLGERTLIIEATEFGTKRRLVIDKNNNIVAEIFVEHYGRWERMGWLIDASDLIGVALRRTARGQIAETNIVETTDVVVIELGEIA